MAYMSYCRFEGTLHELRACIADVQEHIDEEARYEVSDSEIEKFKIMVHEFVEFLNENQIIDADINEAVLDDVAQAMEKGDEEDFDLGF